MTTTTHHDSDTPRLDEVVQAVVQDARDARAAAVIYEGSSDVESRYADQVSTMLATVELDLGVARALLDAHQAATAEEIHTPMQRLVESTRAWAEDLNVQSALARMEVHDRAEAAGRRAEVVAAQARRAAVRVSESVDDDVSRLRKVAVDGITEVRTALDDAVSAIRASW